MSNAFPKKTIHNFALTFLKRMYYNSLSKLKKNTSISDNANI